MQIKKAVFPVAGLGSRFLPATKANPKEMLPIVDKPLIQYAVEEAVRANFTHMIFITSSTKRSIEDHFDNNFELERRLEDQGKTELLAVLKNVAPSDIQFTYVRQNQPLGLGHAILCAEQVIGNEPFAVLLADDLIDESKIPCLSKMVSFFNETNSSVIAVQSVADEEVFKYGIVKVENPNDIYSPILGMVEKPKRESAPSNLAAVGRYIFTPEIFFYLNRTSADHLGEIQLTNAIQELLQEKRIGAYQFKGNRYDCGSKLGYLQAVVELALRHPEIGESFQRYLKKEI